MITLYPYQKTAVKFADQNKKAFIEAPTGSGKSIMIAHLAKKYADEGKKVVVSTHTNQLALELLKDLKEKFNLTKADIVVGKSNYIDIENLDFSEISKLIDAKDFIQELAALTANFDVNKNEEYLIDVFLDKFDIDESTKELLVRLLKTENPKDFIKKFSDIQVSVTNHYYLIYELLFNKEENFNNYVFILDEAHQLLDAMETIFTHNFSLFRFRYLLNNFMEEIKFMDFRGQKTLMKRLSKLRSIVNTMFRVYTNENSIGTSYTGDKKHISIIRKFCRFIVEENMDLYNKVKKVVLPNPKTRNLLLEEWKELIEIRDVAPNTVTFYYSPAKGYPSLSAIKGNIYKKMRIMWKRIQNVKGFSATFSIPTYDEYFRYRLCILKEDNVKFYKIAPVFKKEQINYFIVGKDFPKPKTTEESVDLNWIKAVGDFIIDTFEEKNTLVLMGGFLEVDNLYDYLSLKLNVPILRASKNKSAYNIIKQFKRQGGILIGTRNYGMGIDLKGNMLEKLYIAKLPYPVIGNKKWLEKMEKDKANGEKTSYFQMRNEMLLNLKQWTGRLIRSSEDKGDLYVLDSRANNDSKLRSGIEKTIENIFR